MNGAAADGGWAGLQHIDNREEIQDGANETNLGYSFRVQMIDILRGDHCIKDLFVVGDEKNPPSRALLFLQHGKHFDRALEVQPVERFIEDEDGGVEEEAAKEIKSLFLSPA